MAIVKSEYGKVFGLYTNIDWEQVTSQHVRGDGKTFKFSLNDDGLQKFPVLKGKTEILNTQMNIIGAPEFIIRDRCHMTRENKARAGQGFELPKSLT